MKLIFHERKGKLMAIISMKNVNLRKQGKDLLQDINWTVEKGQTWAILGLNGAGKTTLLKLIMAELYPSQGEINILGTQFGQGDITKLRKRIGIVSGFITDRLSLHLFAEQAVLTGKYKSSILYKDYGSKELTEARDMLTSLGGQALIGRRLYTLSQGERQLIMIARCLMEEPDIIILDEPFSGLDPVNAQIFKDAIKEAVSKGKLVIFSSHQMAYVEEMCDEITLIDQGNIIISGDLEEIKRKEGEDKLVLRVNSEDSIAVEDVLRNKFGLDFQKVNDEYLITKDAQHTSNEILRELLNHVHEIISFGQYRPSLQDIFVNKVGGEANA